MKDKDFQKTDPKSEGQSNAEKIFHSVAMKRGTIRRDDEKNKQGQDSARSGVYLFLSFDISNSTLFKVEYPQLWGNVVTYFYAEVLKLTDTEVYKGSETQMIPVCWKLVGDEVLLYMRVYQLRDLYIMVKEAEIFQSKILDNVIRKIQMTSEDHECRGCYGHCQDVKYSIKSMLGIKATAWIAMCDEEDLVGKPNIVYHRDGLFGEDTVDFLGRDIDEGFRIAHQAAKNRLIVSPLLAWLIWKNAQGDQDQEKIVNANFRITAFLKLKGVWNERPVPIVMYCQKFEKFDEILAYDETDLAVYSNLKGRSISDFFSDPMFQISRLDKIFADIHRDQENYELYHMLLDQTEPVGMEAENKPIRKIHLACALFTKDEKLLIHTHERNGLEFGCVRLNIEPDTSWDRICRQGYQEKYGLTIELDQNPIPVATYVFDKEGTQNNERILGIIFIGNLPEESTWGEDWCPYTKEEIEKIEVKQKKVNNFIKNALNCFRIREIYKETEGIYA